MTNVTVLEELAKSCRRGLVSLSALPGSAFSGFPKGSCGPAAEIVGRILKEEAGYEGVYVCGYRHLQLKPSQSHAWYEVDDYIIDVTYDQFKGTGLTGWVFRRGQGWHAEFADVDRRPGFCMPAGWPCYPHDGYEAVARQLSAQMR
jgi:hypothetical protein